ncbi:MAG: hypothetical protein HY292_15385 [Planctomycetes bacterium]|nr:hypothetical protein [Planctomycetota bacterium]
MTSRPIASVLALLVFAPLARAQDGYPLDVRPTRLVKGPAEKPATIIELRLTRALAEPARIRARTPAGEALLDARPEPNAAGTALRVAVPIPEGIADAPLLLAVTEGERDKGLAVTVRRPDTGWVLHLIPGFHYDPVWWNTQAHYTETGFRMGPETGSGLQLVQAYLDLARAEPSFRFVLHQLPYLKTFFEARPDLRAELGERIRDGRCELVGGTYNEPQSTLVSAEAMARNAIYGMLFQNEVLNGSASAFWQCDVFGHDPSFPSLMARSRHTAGAFARGPFHQWGAPRDEVNFPSEFLWMAPDGESILTHYMTGHYGYAYGRLRASGNRASDDPAKSGAAIEAMFEDLSKPALTHHVLLPMVEDFVRPMQNLADVVRQWNETYLSPRCVIDTPKGFFDAVRAEVASRGIEVPVVTRDMNPIYTGCPVSFADLKLANRAAESTLRDAEAWATLAALEGARYPSLAIDRAWRQLLFNAHHDGVTGSMSDQVYLDVMAGYRDALDLAREVRDRAIAFLARRVDTRGEGDAPAMIAWNSVASKREGVPAFGWSATRPPAASLSTPPVGPTVENEFLRVTVDASKGGAISSLFDKRVGRELLRAPGNDVVALPEYPSLPGHGEGPWHLAPTGERRPGTSALARLLPRDPARPNRIVVESEQGEFRKRQSIEVPAGIARVDCVTTILDWKGRNECLRVEFPIQLAGARPIFETAAAVIGRPFARDVDAQKDAWTLDQTCWHWVDLGVACAAEVVDGSRVVHRRALGVGEIVLGKAAPRETIARAGTLAEALVKCGVTTTITREDERRYGDLAYDSNVPDFRILLGTTADHGLLAAVAKDRSIEEFRTASCLVELRDAVPLILLDPGAPFDAALAELNEAHRIRFPVTHAFLGSRYVADDYGVALVNQGPVSVHASADGTLGLNLLRSCTSWPAGTWIDGDARRLPDGHAFETMHGTHVFRYSIVPHLGDFRAAELSRVGQEVNHPIVTRAEPRHAGALPPEGSFVEINGAGVILAALKPEGFGEARWAIDPKPDPPKVLVARLWNGGGRAVEAGVALRGATGKAWRGNLLEERLEEIPVRDGAARVTLQPNAYETVLLEVASKPTDANSASLDPTEGDVSPSAYWLEDLGEGVTANGAIAIAPEVRTAKLEGGAASVRVRIENNQKSQTADISLRVEASDRLDVSIDPERSTVEPRGVCEATLRVRTKDGMAAPGRSLVTISGTGIGARTVTASVWIEEAAAMPLGPDVEIENTDPVASTGCALGATIRNRTAGPITGEATWLAPMSLWPSVARPTQRVTIPGGGAASVSCPLVEPVGSWALLRFAYGGRIAYGETIAVTGNPERAVLSFPTQHLRIRRDEGSEVSVNAVSAGGLTAESKLVLDAPTGWDVREVDRSFSRVGHSGARLCVRFSVTPHGDTTASPAIRATAPDGDWTDAEVTVPPVQAAKPTADAIVVDGDLGEWDATEFTTTTGDRGVLRAAVRWSENGVALAFDVADDRFSQNYSGSEVYRGDAMQFAFLPEAAAAAGDDRPQYEFGAALTKDGPILWCWQAGTEQRSGVVTDAKVVVQRGTDHTRYEIFVPRSAIRGISLAAGEPIAFTYAERDDDDTGTPGIVEWTKGIAGQNDPVRLGMLQLEAR